MAVHAYELPSSKMSFPKLGLLAGVAAVLVAMLVLEQPLLTSLLVGSLLFMGLGGLQYTRMVIKYLPRDLW